MVRLWLEEDLNYRIISSLDSVGLSRESLENYVLIRDDQPNLKGLVVYTFEYNEFLSGLLGGNNFREKFIVARIRKARLKDREIKPYAKITGSSLIGRKKSSSSGVLLAYKEDIIEVIKHDNGVNLTPFLLERHGDFIYSVFHTFHSEKLKNRLRTFYNPLVLLSKWDDFP